MLLLTNRVKIKRLAADLNTVQTVEQIVDWSQRKFERRFLQTPDN